MNSYPYFTLQQKLENIDQSLKEVVQNYIQFIIELHSAQNSDIIKSNTSYALRLRESEIKNKQLQVENIELRVTVAQLRAKLEKLKYQRTKTNDSFKESVKSANDKIISFVQQLQCAVDSLNNIVDPESTRGSSFTSDGSSILSSSVEIQYSELMSDTDTTTEMLPHKKKPVNLLTVYRKKSKVLAPIDEFKEDQKDPKSSNSASSSHGPERVEEESFSLRSETFQRVRANLTQKRAQIPQDLPQEEYIDNFSQSEQEIKSSNCMHETREESVEPTMPQHLQSVTEKVTSQPTTMHNENSIEIPFQESCKIDDSQQVEESSQNVKRREKRNKKHTRVEPECLIGVNEGESRGRRRSQVNYAEPNLRSKLRKGDPHTYTLKIDSRK